MEVALSKGNPLDLLVLAQDVKLGRKVAMKVRTLDDLLDFPDRDVAETGHLKLQDFGGGMRVEMFTRTFGVTLAFPTNLL